MSTILRTAPSVFTGVPNVSTRVLGVPARVPSVFGGVLFGALAVVLAAAAPPVAADPPSAGSADVTAAEASAGSSDEAAGAAAPVRFARDIRPLFNTHCIACHGGVKEAGGVSLILRRSVLGEADSGEPIVIPGDPEWSAIMRRVTSDDPYERMPPPEHGRALSEDEIQTLRHWIEQGAAWEEHWAYEAPQRADAVLAAMDEVPKWSHGVIDTLVQRRWETEAAPRPPAPRQRWLRRVTLDLTGMPPTLEQYEAYAADRTPFADARVVDRLLASPRLAERWATVWLDLARYADTKGYEKDPHRDIWPYRDWVIRAIDQDMPFDAFTIKQLAGDLLPGATTDDLVATAFHRNTQTNTEGGTDDEVFRLAAVMDRLQTTFEVWQATTIGCVQCHSHPYDPIEHEEYYRLLAFFNTSQDVDLDDDRPTLRIPTATGRDSDPRRAELAGHVRRLRTAREARRARAAARLEDRAGEAVLRPIAASSTGLTQLEIHGEPREVHALGTLTSGSRYTLDYAVPESLESLGALRLDVLPEDVAAARRNPETGFVVSHLEATWLGGTSESPEPLAGVPLVMVLGDDPLSLDSPQASLSPDADGWSAKPKIDRPRTAVFLPEHPIPRPAEAIGLRLQINHRQTLTGSIPLVVRRLRVSTTASPAWTEWLQDAETQRLEQEIASAAAAVHAASGPAVPVMQEQSPAMARETFVFTRGNWLEKGEAVRPDVPGVLPPLEIAGPQPAQATPENASPPDRLDLARWIASPDNPLTARVMVNRVWFQLFGTGLVTTLEDFGSPGQPPTHPELLDDLAVRFAGPMQWSTKRLIREIVLSAVYRQSAQASAAEHRRDPHNLLLKRGPRNRLTAEMIRDQALEWSGLLSERRYGPSVMPPQPDGVWLSPYNGAKWETASGENRFRRALYTYWKRTSAYPSLLTFDATSRERCTLRRIPTNTPLQALVTMNDPAYVELARGLAERMRREGGEELDEQIRWAVRLCTGQPPSSEFAAALQQLAGQAREAYGQDPAAQGIAKTASDYARFIVAHTLMNLDQTLVR
ncbi:PSD1 and planctomycete cytochrome C domain-containing protein [Roseimaritima sediminicola]|uniref:PSD1 and planctomycete cytochrome C domain-containing protein n=1 Tax=Roseimaritima sediminicola TaxID=2662066 RepID=UPI0012984187|nr:PSD1 and planctomycete cytochrome C domain-containing protein [Roseimaritima sediminicola]